MTLLQLLSTLPALPGTERAKIIEYAQAKIHKRGVANGIHLRGKHFDGSGIFHGSLFRARAAGAFLRDSSEGVKVSKRRFMEA